MHNIDFKNVFNVIIKLRKFFKNKSIGVIKHLQPISTKLPCRVSRGCDTDGTVLQQSQEFISANQTKGLELILFCSKAFIHP